MTGDTWFDSPDFYRTAIPILNLMTDGGEVKPPAPHWVLGAFFVWMTLVLLVNHGITTSGFTRSGLGVSPQTIDLPSALLFP